MRMGTELTVSLIMVKTEQLRRLRLLSQILVEDLATAMPCPSGDLLQFIDAHRDHFHLGKGSKKSRGLSVICVYEDPEDNPTSSENRQARWGVFVGLAFAAAVLLFIIPTLIL